MADLIFREPLPLVGSQGVKWDFQRRNELKDQLKSPLLRHIRNYRTKDKTDIPLYSFASGVAIGTGNSRNAQELVTTNTFPLLLKAFSIQAFIRTAICWYLSYIKLSHPLLH